MIKVSYDQKKDKMTIRFSDCPAENKEFNEDAGFIVNYNKNDLITCVEIPYFSRRVNNSWSSVAAMVKSGRNFLFV